MADASVKKSFDCIIVGAGPAGAYLGYLVSALGFKCLILEKKPVPRYKTCGGGLTRRALELLPFDLDGVIEDMAFRARLGFGHSLTGEAASEQPMIGLVMRSKFDSYLVSKAQEAGAAVLTDTAFENASLSHGGSIDVKTSKGSFKTLILVGGDGVNSRVARVMGLWKNGVGCPAIEAEVYPADPWLMDAWRGCVDFDFGAAPKGYGWVFPKADHLSVGVFSTSREVKDLKGSLLKYIAEKGLNKTKIKEFRGHMIPLGPHDGPFANKNSLLVGDAAGLADPITGEGIYHALRQAEIAAMCIARSLTDSKSDLTTYNNLIKKEFLQELRYAKRLARLFYDLPRLSHLLVKAKKDTVIRYHLDIITGKKTYKELFFKALNPINLLPFQT
ncbi:MAG: geranylgeranyl reductase family protein [Dissulfurimicrobium sp.]|uniref:geranylgeranyl reductase family protein n=1 Tax=Dissulfurimicrobium sp. TaxID=2022436 RepID=UPI0040493820